MFLLITVCTVYVCMCIFKGRMTLIQSCLNCTPPLRPGCGPNNLWEQEVFFSYFSVLLPVLAFFIPLSHRKDSWICSFTERKKLKAGTFFFSVRFKKITPIMILLATGKMWLLKMDLWKIVIPKKQSLNGSKPLHRSYSLCKFILRVSVCVLKANKSESHNPRPQVPLQVPSRLPIWNLGTIEAELIWQRD